MATELDDTILDIARKNFSVTTLEEQHSGDDFHEVCIASIKSALTTAWNKGYQSVSEDLPGDNDTLNQDIEEIGKRKFSVETMETRNRDSLDFYELATWTMKDALMEAYEHGVIAANLSHSLHP